MITWGSPHSLPITAVERRRRVKIVQGVLVGTLTVLAVVGTYRAGQESVSDDLSGVRDSLDTHKLAVEELTEREEMSMAYLAEHHPQAERELRARTKLWGRLP